MLVFNKLSIQFFELHLQKNRFLCLIIILVISFVVFVFELLSPVLSDSETSWTAAHQAPLASTIWVCSNSCPLSWWYFLTISSSAAPFSFCLQSFPTSESFPLSQLSASGGQSNGVSASASFLAMNIQGWFPLLLTGLISLQFKGFSRAFSSAINWKYQFFSDQPSLGSTLTHSTLITGKTIALTIGIFVCKVMSLFNTMSLLIHCLGLSQVSFQAATVF